MICPKWNMILSEIGNKGKIVSSNTGKAMKQHKVCHLFQWSRNYSLFKPSRTLMEKERSVFLILYMGSIFYNVFFLKTLQITVISVQSQIFLISKRMSQNWKRNQEQLLC